MPGIEPMAVIWITDFILIFIMRGRVRDLGFMTSPIHVYTLTIRTVVQYPDIVSPSALCQAILNFSGCTHNNPAVWVWLTKIT